MLSLKLLTQDESNRIKSVIAISVRYHSRLDKTRFLSLLPTETPSVWLHDYLMLCKEHNEAKNRNMHILYQLLRTHEVSKLAKIEMQLNNTLPSPDEDLLLLKQMRSQASPNQY